MKGTHGGRREGGGRKAGVPNKRSLEAAERAEKLGLLPHEFLAKVSRGEAIDGVIPTLAQRMQAANDCGQYFAAKLTSQAVSHSGNINTAAIDRPPPETRAQWFARRQRELLDGPPAGTAD